MASGARSKPSGSASMSLSSILQKVSGGFGISFALALILKKRVADLPESRRSYLSKYNAAKVHELMCCFCNGELEKLAGEKLLLCRPCDTLFYAAH